MAPSKETGGPWGPWAVAPCGISVQWETAEAELYGSTVLPRESKVLFWGDTEQTDQTLNSLLHLPVHSCTLVAWPRKCHAQRLINWLDMLCLPGKELDLQGSSPVGAASHGLKLCREAHGHFLSDLVDLPQPGTSWNTMAVHSQSLFGLRWRGLRGHVLTVHAYTGPKC